MKKWFFVLLACVTIFTSSVPAQELFEKGRGFHIDQLGWSFGFDENGRLSGFGTANLFRIRVNDSLDLGFLADLSLNGKDSLVDYDRNRFTFGPVVGYTHTFSNSGWGIRTNLGLRFSFSNISESFDNGLSVTSAKMALAGYGADLTVALFKKFKVSSSINIFPGIGFFANASHLTGKRWDGYASNNFWGHHVDFLEYVGESGNIFNGGLFLQAPVSIKVLGHNRLTVEPYYIYNFKKIAGLSNNRFGLRFRLSF